MAPKPGCIAGDKLEELDEMVFALTSNTIRPLFGHCHLAVISTGGSEGSHTMKSDSECSADLSRLNPGGLIQVRNHSYPKRARTWESKLEAMTMTLARKLQFERRKHHEIKVDE